MGQKGSAGNLKRARRLSDPIASLPPSSCSQRRCKSYYWDEDRIQDQESVIRMLKGVDSPNVLNLSPPSSSEHLVSNDQAGSVVSACTYRGALPGTEGSSSFTGEVTKELQSQAASAEGSGISRVENGVHWGSDGPPQGDTVITDCETEKDSVVGLLGSDCAIGEGMESVQRVDETAGVPVAELCKPDQHDLEDLQEADQPLKFCSGDTKDFKTLGEKAEGRSTAGVDSKREDSADWDTQKSEVATLENQDGVTLAQQPLPVVQTDPLGPASKGHLDLPGSRSAKHPPDFTEQSYLDLAGAPCVLRASGHTCPVVDSLDLAVKGVLVELKAAPLEKPKRVLDLGRLSKEEVSGVVSLTSIEETPGPLGVEEFTKAQVETEPDRCMDGESLGQGATQTEDTEKPEVEKTSSQGEAKDSLTGEGKAAHEENLERDLTPQLDLNSRDSGIRIKEGPGGIGPAEDSLKPTGIQPGNDKEDSPRSGNSNGMNQEPPISLSPDETDPAKLKKYVKRVNFICQEEDQRQTTVRLRNDEEESQLGRAAANGIAGSDGNLAPPGEQEDPPERNCVNENTEDQENPASGNGAGRYFKEEDQRQATVRLRNDEEESQLGRAAANGIAGSDGNLAPPGEQEDPPERNCVNENTEDQENPASGNGAGRYFKETTINRKTVKKTRKFIVDGKEVSVTTSKIVSDNDKKDEQLRSGKKQYYDQEIEKVERQYRQSSERMEQDHTVRLRDEARRLKALQEKEYARRSQLLRTDSREFQAEEESRQKAERLRQQQNHEQRLRELQEQCDSNSTELQQLQVLEEDLARRRKTKNRVPRRGSEPETRAGNRLSRFLPSLSFSG
ncbi:UNVERIFIED_CONTAM: hypothetical protein FKN15_026814 [Acipenser sinensis]